MPKDTPPLTSNPNSPIQIHQQIPGKKNTGAPWLKALTVGLAANALAIPVAAALGQVFRCVVSWFSHVCCVYDV